jgi:glycosyltransferase involved in cell wall biosynthesis
VKGIAYLAAAYSRVRERLDVGLTVLGPGADAATVLAAFPERARGGVTVLPRAPEDEVMRHYATHDVLAHPSTFEGFGMAVVEAMSQRLPVVATPQGCAPAVVRDGESGLLVPERDPVALAAALVRVLADPALARRLGDAAHATVRDLTWRTAAERTLAVYAEALERNALADQWTRR